MRDEKPTDESATTPGTAGGATHESAAEETVTSADGAPGPGAPDDDLDVDAEERPVGAADDAAPVDGHAAAARAASEDDASEDDAADDVEPAGQRVGAAAGDDAQASGDPAPAADDPADGAQDVGDLGDGAQDVGDPGDGSGTDGRDDDAPAPRPTPRAVLQSVGMLVVAVLAGLLAVLPAPYAVNMPGLTKDVLGEVGGEPLIAVDGAETYPSTGRLLLTTLSGVGGPGYPAYVLDVLRGWFSSSSVVRPAEDVYPQDVSREELDASNQGAMLSSQDNAVVAALVELGYEVPATLVVAGTVEGSDAQGRLEEGDVLTAMDGERLPDYQTLVHRLDDVKPGDTVTLTVTRHARDVDVDVVTTPREGGGAQIGVYIDPSFDMPVDVSINIEGIGGPSAGTMFALGIVDLLTPEDEAAGQVIAGTGTIDVVGTVGRIGGIRQKLVGARRDGATWFLAPAGNCDDVVGHVPDGLRVVSVSTLHDAREAMTAIGKGEADDLPTCVGE